MTYIFVPFVPSVLFVPFVAKKVSEQLHFWSVCI